MESAEYKRMRAFEEFYWWHVGRRNIVERILRRILGKQASILEIGCGTGGNLKLLGKFGQVTGLDPSKEALDFCRSQGFSNVVEGSAEDSKLPSESFDVLVALDVLEHIEDDARAFRECFRLLRDDGYLLITVPAFPFLWSEHDEALHHKRRYRRVEIKQKMEAAGFEITRLSYLIMFPFPLIVVYRFLRRWMRGDKQKRTSYVLLPGWLNRLLIVALQCEGILLSYMNLPFGTSIICVAQKKNG